MYIIYRWRYICIFTYINKNDWCFVYFYRFYKNNTRNYFIIKIVVKCYYYYFSAAMYGLYIYLFKFKSYIICGYTRIYLYISNYLYKNKDKGKLIYFTYLSAAFMMKSLSIWRRKQCVPLLLILYVFGCDIIFKF